MTKPYCLSVRYIGPSRYIKETDHSPYVYPYHIAIAPHLSKPYILHCATEEVAHELIKPLNEGLEGFLHNFFENIRGHI